MTTSNPSFPNSKPSQCSAALEPRLPEPQRLDLAKFAPDINTQLDLLRLDSIDSLLGGNKWFKLMPWLEQAQQENTDCLLSFGGPHSNHIHALAAAGARYSFRTIGYVRGGPWLEQRLSPTLQDARTMGMQLVFVDKIEYARRIEPQWREQLAKEYAALVIPEGGYSQLVLPALARLGEHISAFDYDWVSLACGTGTTLAGIACGLQGDARLHGFSVLKDNGSVSSAVKALLQDKIHHPHWQVNETAHFGGYARINKNLVDFMDRFEGCTGVALDPVYTAKMMSGLFTQLRRTANAEPLNTPKKILAIHTGGLQGRRAMEAKMAKLRATAQ